MQKAVFIIFLVGTVLITSNNGHAQAQGSSDCLVPSNVDLVTMNSPCQLQAGDRLLIQAGQNGTRGRIKFKGIRGTLSKPILIENYGGKVTLKDSGSDYLLLVMDSEYIKLKGSGSSHQYGFELDGNKTTRGIRVGKTSHLEIERVRVHHTTHSGIKLIYTESDNTTVKDLVIHQNYIHDTGTEGMYLGKTYNNESTPRIDGLKVYDNLVERSGWDGIDVKTVTNARVYRNVINVSGDAHSSIDGKAGVSWKNTNTNSTQNSGINVNSGTRDVEYYNNFIIKAGGVGIRMRGDNMRIYNNVIDQAGDRVRAQFSSSGKGIDWWVGGGRVYHNTVLNSRLEGVRIKSNINSSGELYNNIAVGSGLTNIKNEGSATLQDNLTGTVASALFNPGSYPNPQAYTLSASSPAIDAGTKHSGDTCCDYLGTVRDNQPDIGAFEFSLSQPSPSPGIFPTPSSTATPTPSINPGNFMIGDLVEAIETLKVKEKPGEILLGTQLPGARGIILAGPELGVGGEYWWWKIDFDAGSDGWSREDLLKVVSGATLTGDIDGDGDVDIFDYNILVSEFGAIGGSPTDINNDGKVDIFDYNILVENFGR